MSETDRGGASPPKRSTRALHGLRDAELSTKPELRTFLDVPTEPQAKAFPDLATKPALPLLNVPDTRKDQPAAPDVLEGTSFKIVKELSEGGMGTIYLAEHRELGRRFAIKVLREEMNPTPDLVERLRREARAASLVDHPGVVDVTDFGVTAKGRPFVVMEHIEGRTLADVFDDDGVVEQRSAVVIGLALCEALDAVHREEIIHRDVKPENIFLIGEDEERIKLVDFGLALSPEHIDARLTRHGVVFGTPSYMSPEQVRRRPLTPASDVYSLGVIIYEMVTGTIPFEAETAFEVLTLKIKEPPERPTKRMKGRPLHPRLEQVILRCLELEPDERYGSMLEVAEALSEVLDELDQNPDGPWESNGAPLLAEVSAGEHSQESGASRRRWPIVLGVIAAIAFALGSGTILVRWARPDDLASPRMVESPQNPATGLTASKEPNPVIATVSSSPETDPGGPAIEPVVEEPGGAEDNSESASTPSEGDAASDGAPARGGDSTRGREDESGRDRQGARRSTSSRELVAEGHQLLRRRQLDAAYRAFQRAARFNPGSAGAQAGLGRVAFERGQYSAAVAHLERALRANPGNNNLRLLLGSAYLRQGQSARAIEQWERILARDPNNRAARRMLETVRGN